MNMNTKKTILATLVASSLSFNAMAEEVTVESESGNYLTAALAATAGAIAGFFIGDSNSDTKYVEVEPELDDKPLPPVENTPGEDDGVSGETDVDHGWGIGESDEILDGNWGISPEDQDHSIDNTVKPGDLDGSVTPEVDTELDGDYGVAPPTGHKPEPEMPEDNTWHGGIAEDGDFEQGPEFDATPDWGVDGIVDDAPRTPDLDGKLGGGEADVVKPEIETPRPDIGLELVNGKIYADGKHVADVIADTDSNKIQYKIKEVDGDITHRLTFMHEKDLEDVTPQNIERIVLSAYGEKVTDLNLVRNTDGQLSSVEGHTRFADKVSIERTTETQVTGNIDGTHFTADNTDEGIKVKYNNETITGQEAAKRLADKRGMSQDLRNKIKEKFQQRFAK